MERYPVVRDATRLRTVHRQRVERHGEQAPRPALDASAFSPAVRARATQGFTQLLETECESVVIAGWMSAALCRIGAPLDLVGAFAKVVEDEVRHVDLLCMLLEDLGATPTLPIAPLPPSADVRRGGAALEEVLCGLMGFFCVGEELSGHIFKASLELAEAPTAIWTVSEIFRDEATHGAFGFESARALLGELDAAARARVGVRLQSEIAAFEKRLGGPLDGAARSAFSENERALAKLGLLPREALLSIFYERLSTHVLPRLAEVGLPIALEVRRKS
jgi:hypothetical protein